MRLFTFLPLTLVAASSALWKPFHRSEDPTVQPFDNATDTNTSDFFAQLSKTAQAILGDNPQMASSTAEAPNIICHDRKNKPPNEWRGMPGAVCPDTASFHADVFLATANAWCSQYFEKLSVPPGQWYMNKQVQMPCGSHESDNKGHICDFTGAIWINNDNDRGGEGKGWNFIDVRRCNEWTQHIWDACPRKGGYLRTSYGMMFQYCSAPAYVGDAEQPRTSRVTRVSCFQTDRSLRL